VTPEIWESFTDEARNSAKMQTTEPNKPDPNVLQVARELVLSAATEKLNAIKKLQLLQDDQRAAEEITQFATLKLMLRHVTPQEQADGAMRINLSDWIKSDHPGHRTSQEAKPYAQELFNPIPSNGPHDYQLKYENTEPTTITMATVYRIMQLKQGAKTPASRKEIIEALAFAAHTHNQYRQQNIKEQKSKVNLTGWTIEVIDQTLS